jgi:Domain of unknown function (DUF4145)
MPIITRMCPHCRTDHIGLRVAAFSGTGAASGVAHLDCPKCNRPSCALVEGDGTVGMQTWNGLNGDIEQIFWEVTAFWPEAPGPLIPENLPPDVERVYLQAERNFPTVGNEEASGTMYRKALDIGLKKIDPSATGMLKAKIKKLAADGKLTTDIAEWSDHVRDLGNEAAHEEDPPTRDELADLRSFTEMVMRYLFTLPAMVTARKPQIKPQG